ncbi:MAG TPA: DUF4381 family protein [Longimicrobiales bacterium]|nr:DUF4381 family protein [Longimicrobiales bacterium]
MRTALRFALLLLCVGAPAAGQAPQAAVVPRTITVGDVFHAAIRLDAPPGSDITAPQSLALPADVEAAGVREVRVDTAGGVRRITVIYPLTAWRPGAYTLPELSLGLATAAGEREIVVQIPPFEVTSVLPADTAGVEPRPAKDVLGASRVWWPLLILAILAILVALAVWAWRRRRRPDAVTAAVVRVAPREAALARLDELAASGYLERGDVRAFYAFLTETLRHYAASVDPAWGVDLTTRELSVRMRAAGHAESLDLTRILGTADLVKFARATVASAHAAADLQVARTWVQRVPGEDTGADAALRRVA